MKSYIVILFNIIYLAAVCQVKNYAIHNSLDLGTYAYKIYNSNDSNLLLSNKEVNFNVGYTHILKVKPNGDTIFIKSSDAADLFVTSTGNILTNAKDFNIVNQTYSTSYLTMYDRNYNKKWQLDLKGNAMHFPNTPSNTFINGFIVTSIFEINNNHYTIFANITSSHIGGPFNGKTAFNIDSSGNVLTNQILYHYYPLSFDEFINEAKNKVVGFANYHVFNKFPSCEIITYDIANSTSKRMIFDTTSMIPVFKKGIFINDKMYISGVIENHTNTAQTYKKAFISCIDANSNVNWCKTIIPNDSIVNNEISDIIEVDNILLCKYKSDTSFYILSIDTLGQLLNTYQTEANISNLVKFNDNVYTSRTKMMAQESHIALIKMNNVGNYSCAISTSLTISNYSLNTTNNIDNGLASFGSLTYSLSNQPSNIFTYTINLSNGCDIATSLNKKNEEETGTSIYPNPANSGLTISSLKEIQKVELITITDQVLLSEPVNQTFHQLQLQHFAEGIYFVKVVYANGISVTKKVVVNR